MLVTASFSWDNAEPCASPQHHSMSSRVSSRNGLVKLERCGRKLLRYCVNPRSHCTPALSVGLGISRIALTLAGSTRRPVPVATWPMKDTSVCLSRSLSLFSLMPRASHRASHRSKNDIKLLSWSWVASSSVSPNPTTTKSSATTSGADRMPKDMGIHRNLLKERVKCSEE